MTELPDAIWRKSTYSGSNGGQCVEICAIPGVVAVRDSKDPQGSYLAFAPDEWSSFIEFAAAQDV